MPLNGTALGDAVAAAIIATDPGMTDDQKAQLQSSWEAIGQAIVTYFVANTEVIVESVSGVMTGGGTSGPGTGTIE